MKRITPISIVVLIMFLATACASASPATQESAATEATPLQLATLETPPVGTGTPIDITLADNTIEASQLEFQVGVPYSFVITNTGTHAHNFNVNPPVSMVGSLEAALDSALLVVPQQQLGPGASVTVDFTFPPDSAGQLLEFSCLIRRHYDDGMKVDITVTQ
jgi:uncharacterized cupredoxin-like copper-binding protein